MTGRFDLYDVHISIPLSQRPMISWILPIGTVLRRIMLLPTPCTLHSRFDYTKSIPKSPSSYAPHRHSPHHPTTATKTPQPTHATAIAHPAALPTPFSAPLPATAGALVPASRGAPPSVGATPAPVGTAGTVGALALPPTPPVPIAIPEIDVLAEYSGTLGPASDCVGADGA